MTTVHRLSLPPHLTTYARTGRRRRHVWEEKLQLVFVSSCNFTDTYKFPYDNLPVL